ncbi:Non-specific serine/threonine protein kinase [Handroanthus impetiginosus]|uniref:Non-specific serine/threonine protein kinase n=1 Tax=Handroanthus impetiginosus TaxID=429701 RepID=A0A2G9GYC6_9LAMI|nr:Non-specific serine/threonine protein kinase [Handroanthus impetiginosus]
MIANYVIHDIVQVVGLARLNHENVGKLLGYCRESNPFTRMVVFEYASNGTLIGRGLKYLHTELDPPFTISKLNSSSVYLTEDFSPKVTLDHSVVNVLRNLIHLIDKQAKANRYLCFSITKFLLVYSQLLLLSRSEKSSGTISNESADCILPKSLEGSHLDIQGNIYAFGILLLEIVSGRPPYSQEEGCSVDWAKEFLDMPNGMSKIVDPELKEIRHEDLKIILEVVNLCINLSSSTRTSMGDLCSMLESRIDTSVSVASSLAWAELALSSS